jgi:hypothetical protein
VQGAAGETLAKRLFTDGKISQAQLDEVLQYLQDAGNKALDPSNAKNTDQRLESLSVGMETVMRRVNTPTVKGMDEEFIAESGLLTAAKKGDKYDREAIHLGTMNQHALAHGYGRILGQLRAKIKPKMKGGGRNEKTGQMPREQVPELVSRLTLMEASLRSAGIPLVTVKAVAQGIAHVSYVTGADAVRILLKETGASTVRSTVQASVKVTNNIQFQNLSEAVRRVIEHADQGKAFDGDQLSELRKAIGDALTTGQGVPIGKKSKEAFEEAMNWAKKSPEGKKAVTTLIDALTRPAVVEALITENRKLMTVTAVLARGDGIRMTEKIIDSISSLKWSGERLDGYGKLLFEGGLKQVFGKDPLVRLSPENLNLTFGDQNLFRLMSNLPEGDLAAVSRRHKNTKAAEGDNAIEAATGKPSNRKRTTAIADELEDLEPRIDEHATDRVAGDPEARATGLTVEEATMVQKAYIEATYGTMVGGAIKLFGAISNKVAMGGELTTRLVGAEHEYLMNAVEFTSGLTKLSQVSGKTAAEFNKIFQSLQKGEKLPGKDGEIQTILTHYIDQLFGMGDTNLFAAENIFPKELGMALDKLGLGRYGAEFKTTTDPLAFKDYWKQIEIEGNENILEILSKFNTAKQISTVRPYLAASLKANFGHKKMGYTTAEAVKMGWKEASADTQFGEYLFAENLKDKVLFSPEMLDKIRAMNHYLDYERGFKGNAGKVWEKLDPIVSVLKSSLTIWRPGHHAVSTLGNMMMNTLAGVWGTRDYGTALKLLQLKDNIKIDEEALAGILRREIKPGYKFKPVEEGIDIQLYEKGKVKTFTMSLEDAMKLIDGQTGVRITPHAAADVQTDIATGAIGKQQNMIVKPVAAVDHGLAQFAATRDNLFRYALFTKAMRTGGPFKSIDEAAQYAAKQVHEFHPTVGTLSGFERKNARRLFYFYTWQKQALVKMLEMAANQPAAITIPSKLQFAIAEMNGLNPNSFGDPHDPQAMYAAYNSNSLYGPQWKDDTWGAMGIKPASPQLDVFDSILGKFKTRPQDSMYENIAALTVGGWFDLAAANASPLFKIPAELATGNRFDDMGKIDMSQKGLTEYAINQTGFGSLARFMGAFNDGTQTEYDKANEQRQIWNYLFGTKTTFYESPAAITRGRQEMVDYWQKTNKVGKYYEGNQ